MMNNTINNAFANTLERPWSKLKENYEFSLEELACFEKEHNGLNPDQFYHIYHHYANQFAELLSDFPNGFFDTRFEFPEKKIKKEYPSVFMVYEINHEVDEMDDYPRYYTEEKLLGIFESRPTAEKYAEKYNSTMTYHDKLGCTNICHNLKVVESQIVTDEMFDENDDLGYKHRPWDEVIDFRGYIDKENLPTRQVLSRLWESRGIKLTEYGLEQMLVDVFKIRAYCPERMESKYTHRGHINWQKIEWEELLDSYALRKEELEKEIYPALTITLEPITSKKSHKWFEEDWELDPFNI